MQQKADTRDKEDRMRETLVIVCTQKGLQRRARHLKWSAVNVIIVIIKFKKN